MNLNFISTRGFISKCGAYQGSSFPRRHLGCFGHFVFMCSLLTFLFHMDITSFFFFSSSFGEFQWESYAYMCEYYGSRIVGVFSGPLSKMSSSTTNIFWWYGPSLYGGLCPICFSKELGFDGSIFVL